MHEFWLLLAIAGLFMIPLGLIWARNARRSWDWPTATAIISAMGPLRHRTTENAEYGTQHWVRVSYAYEYPVGGMTHRIRSEKEASVNSARDEGEVGAFRRRNPVGGGA